MTNHPLLSVCICTHNPRRDYFPRVLDALKAQTLEQRYWELILIDNQSSEPIADWINLTGFENVLLFGEEQLGLTHARLRAISQARGDALVFVDDDNVLDPEYLENARLLLERHPFIGIMGGKCLGRYEVEPRRWSYRFLPYMAVSDHGRHPIWAFHRHTYQPWFPYGAGLVIRRELAREYFHQLQLDPDRKQYGRRGRILSGSEDIDMVFTTIDAGHAAGYFPELRLEHLIPRERLRYRYIRRLVYDAHRSAYHLMLTRGIHHRPRRWPVAYLAAILQCALAGDWHPLTLLISLQVARGRYSAYRLFKAERREAQRVAHGAGRGTAALAANPPGEAA